jgi:hypothetical protein
MITGLGTVIPCFLRTACLAKLTPTTRAITGPLNRSIGTVM